MNPVQRQCEILAKAGLMTKTVTESDGATNYSVSPDQQGQFVAILNHPEMWDHSPLLRQCKDALRRMRIQALKENKQ
jgi:hypothetical protein